MVLLGVPLIPAAKVYINLEKLIFIQVADVNKYNNDEANVCLIYLNKRVRSPTRGKINTGTQVSDSEHYLSTRLCQVSNLRSTHDDGILKIKIMKVKIPQVERKAPLNFSYDLGRKVPAKIFFLEYWIKIRPLNFLSWKEPVPLNFRFLERRNFLDFLLEKQSPF